MNQLSLREARLNCRLRLQEVSNKTGISVPTLRRWEADSREITRNAIYKLLSLYGFTSLNHIYFGPEADLMALRQAVLMNNQELISLKEMGQELA
ncbi:MAG TPA: XRE family transcriptional regulator [Brevibacillus sp.]|uniref:helix-turn-helix domain-containing protein n=1 Tax=Brevibacillus TaxID=55080 RepID=UPI000ECA5703|nr:helix-turn-helix transcriptional regulator [Brevibacillus sp.]HBZ80942.1 XRE family transcriptional regulator [Brevibacillus sp.]